MTKYNYLEAVKEDVKNYIDSEINFTDFDSLEELEEKLNDELWIEDSVTRQCKRLLLLQCLQGRRKHSAQLGPTRRSS